MRPGTTLGPYQITSQLGAGGMGEVYAATDARLDRTVAIKVLPEHLASDPSRRERFEREAKAVSSLNHPTVLSCRTRWRYPITVLLSLHFRNVRCPTDPFSLL
jgi:serine/threonine protein kinase